jgi:hypothetical protein
MRTKRKKKDPVLKREHSWKRVNLDGKILRKCKYCGILGTKKVCLVL